MRGVHLSQLRPVLALAAASILLAGCTDEPSPDPQPSSATSAQPSSPAPTVSAAALTPASDPDAFRLPPTTPECDLARAQVVVFTRTHSAATLTDATTAQLRTLREEVARRCAPPARAALEAEVLTPWSAKLPPVVAPG